MRPITSVPARFQYDADRGVIYVFAQGSNECLLRVEGVRDVPEGEQIDIHVVHPGNEHHHENCGNLGLVKKGAGRSASTVCAVRLVHEPQ